MATDQHDLREYILRGDEHAFRRIVERHAPMVNGVALRMTSDWALAEEITQTVFSILARKILSFRHAEIHSWLHSVTVSECRNARRKEARRIRLLNDYSETMMAEKANTPANWADIRPELDEAIAKLSPDDREVMILRFFEQRSFSEISSLTCRKEEACRQKCKRALERLQNILTQRKVLPSGTALTAVLSSPLLFPPTSSAAVISATAISSSSASGASFVKIIIYMTLQNLTKISAAALVLAAIPITIYLRADPLPRVSTASVDNRSSMGNADGSAATKERIGNARGSINWKVVARQFADGDGLSGMIAARKLESRLKDLSAEELAEGLKEVTASDIDLGPKMRLRHTMASILAPLDPMAVLDRFHEDSEKGMAVNLVVGLRELAKRDLAAADAWLSEQMRLGNFDLSLPDRRSEQLPYFQGAILETVGKRDPAEYGRRVLALPPEQRGGAIEWSTDRDFTKAAKIMKSTGDPVVIAGLLESDFTEFTIKMNNTHGRDNAPIFDLLEQLPDSQEKVRIREKLESAATKKYKVDRY